MIDNLDKVHLGKLYFPDDEGTLATQRKAQELMYDFNATRPGEVERGLSLVHSMLAECGPDCWIGASVSILPGISIGDGSVIGAGAVVTKDIPSGVVAAGNPCRVLREISEYDRQYYAKGRRIDWKELEDEIARHKA